MEANKYFINLERIRKDISSGGPGSNNEKNSRNFRKTLSELIKGITAKVCFREIIMLTDFFSKNFHMSSKMVPLDMYPHFFL